MQLGRQGARNRHNKQGPNPKPWGFQGRLKIPLPPTRGGLKHAGPTSQRLQSLHEQRGSSRNPLSPNLQPKNPKTLKIGPRRLCVLGLGGSRVWHGSYKHPCQQKEQHLLHAKQASQGITTALGKDGGGRGVSPAQPLHPARAFRRPFVRGLYEAFRMRTAFIVIAIHLAIPPWEVPSFGECFGFGVQHEEPPRPPRASAKSPAGPRNGCIGVGHLGKEGGGSHPGCCVLASN